MRYLFIAEKPSLMRDVRECYNKHKTEICRKLGMIDFIALSGHVCKLYEPKDYEEYQGRWDEMEYPIIPSYFAIKPISDQGKLNTLKKIKNTAKDYDGIIVGTDSDTEGYGIYYLIENYLKLQKKKTLRFVEHSLTDKEILESLLSMTDFHTDPVHIRQVRAFMLRSRADWLYGMNGTMMMSVATGTLMTVGRVKAPTLKLVYDNSKAIAEFKPETYYNLAADYGDFKGVCKEQYPNAVDAKTVCATLPLTGVIESADKKEVKTRAPQLYDLSSLQSEAGQILDMMPSEIMAVVQSLYEKHKVLSYPRTQCRYVSTEKAKEFPQMLQVMKVFPDLSPLVDSITDFQSILKDKNVVNDKEVQKESHDALLPTTNVPNLSTMTESEIKICKYIYMRLLAQFLPPLVELKTKLVIRHGEKKFEANGKVIKSLGWRALYGTLKDRNLPDIRSGASITAKVIQPNEITTKPVKRLTQATLIDAMKNIAKYIDDPSLKGTLEKGIGTSATRHAIIDDLIRRGYMIDQKKAPKGLYITEQGKLYIESLNGIDIVSPVFAATLDHNIKQIQRGELDYDKIYQKVLNDLYTVCNQMRKIQPPPSKYRCPKCGKPMKEKSMGLFCDCGTKIWLTVAGKKITPKILDTLFAGGITEEYTFTKKDKSKFKAKLKLTENGIEFVFGQKRN